MTSSSPAQAASMLTRTVLLHQVEVLCSIGLHDFEKAEKQRVLIDVALRLSPEGEPSDDCVAETLDYDEVRKTVLARAQAQHYDLQETLARRLFDALAALKHVEGVSVTTQKPDVYPNCKAVAYKISNIDG